MKITFYNMKKNDFCFDNQYTIYQHFLFELSIKIFYSYLYLLILHKLVFNVIPVKIFGSIFLIVVLFF
jgi:hypothetical protein